MSMCDFVCVSLIFKLWSPRVGVSGMQVFAKAHSCHVRYQCLGSINGMQ